VGDWLATKGTESSGGHRNDKENVDDWVPQHVLRHCCQICFSTIIICRDGGFIACSAGPGGRPPLEDDPFVFSQEPDVAA